MIPAERMRAALTSADPTRKLRDVVLSLVAERNGPGEIQSSLEELLLEVRSDPDHREADEDAVLDVLDSLGGWCHEANRIGPNASNPA